MDLSQVVQHTGIPPVQTYKGALMGVYNQVIPANSSIYLKHAITVAGAPVSNDWIIGLTPLLDYFLFLGYYASLLIQTSPDDWVTTLGLNPILLVPGDNHLHGLFVPGMVCRFRVVNASAVGASFVQGNLRMGAM